ncbi:MAG: hypothetical protein KZQ96_23270 [Candidatus Thiodiazotropha sp. (ex Lucinoma borealis)]|nr:hypothetical protein [Candidatus Thiodiazotropha sp. (ex Lucinoma borealis)]
MGKTSAMNNDVSFEEEMEEEILTEESEKEFLARHIDGYQKILSDFRGLKDNRKRYFDINRAALSAYMLGLFDEAELLAKEIFELAEKYPNTWNYGNSIYYGNWVLGMLELDKGNTEKSKEYLLLAGACNGSPQLNSFGPNMRLAKRLLLKGEIETVTKFLNLIATFWTSGSNWLKIWRKMIDEGKQPNCLMHIF